MLMKRHPPHVGFFRNTPFCRDVGGDSILRVDPKAVPSKQLGKALLRIGSMGLPKSKVERIMLSSVNQMPHAMDEVNVCTFLSLMVNLLIDSTRCLESIIPFCYRVSNLQRAIACCHMISMVKGSRSVPIAKGFAVHVAQRLPTEGHSLSFKDLGRLCQSLSALDLYCHELGDVLVTLVNDELQAPCRSVDISIYLTSILLYLGRMGLGDISLWRLYSSYTCCDLRSMPSVLIKALEAFTERNIRDTIVLSRAGDMLAQVVDSLHPLQVPRIADVFVRSGFYHGALVEAVMLNTERLIASLVGGQGALKLLQMFMFAYGAHSTRQGVDLEIRHRRALYLTFNKCSTNINHFDSADLLTIAAAMQLFPSTRSPLLEATIQRLLGRAEGTSKLVVGLNKDVGRPSVQTLASQIIGRTGKQPKHITRADALCLSQLTGVNPFPTDAIDSQWFKPEKFHVEPIAYRECEYLAHHVTICFRSTTCSNFNSVHSYLSSM